MMGHALGLTPKPRIFACFCHPGQVTTGFMVSFVDALSAGKFAVWYESHSGPLLSLARNDLVRAFLMTDCTHMLTLDTDIVFKPEDVDRLVAHNLPIVGGAYPEQHRGGVWMPAAQSDKHVSFPSQRTGLLKVGGVGAGFCLIRREVLEALVAAQPITGRWPYAEMDCREGCTDLLSEDFALCYRAANLGYDTYLDLDCSLGHVKSSILRMDSPVLEHAVTEGVQ
jgi:hypothetical protein